MPGKQVKNWKIYHALRKKRGMSKARAARIANAFARHVKRKRKGKKR